MTQPTPTTDANLLRLGDFATLIEALEHAGRGTKGLNFYRDNAVLDARLSFAELEQRSRALGARLAAAFPAGTPLGILAETCADFAVLFYACQYAGLLPAPLPLPVSLGGGSAYAGYLRRMVESAGLGAIFVPAGARASVDAALEGTEARIHDLSGADLPLATAPLRPFGANDPCYIQFSSGSTTAPKGILGTQFSVTSNCRAIIQDGLKVRAGDRAVSWLPFYHDMGLIGFFLAPMMSQISVDYLTPSGFARRPISWLKLISENRGTLAYSPSFGFEICARRWRGEPLDLTCWRVAGIGGDMVRDKALSVFCDIFADQGFDPSALVPSYGMAEVTLAATFSPLGRGLRRDLVDLDRMRATGVAMPASEITRDHGSRTFISCGHILPGHGLKICDAHGNELGQRRVGRIFLRGPSVMGGYRRADGVVDPAVDAEGWLDTGDLGYWLDDELVITGRHKDLILWNGRNIWPQDLEWTAESATHLNIGKCAAFQIASEDDNEDIVLLVESRMRDTAEAEAMAAELSALVRKTVGVPVRVVPVPARSLIMTSSGKLSRAANRAKYEAGGFGAAEERDAISA